jgi:lipopolysaccharide heptosyltransferase II
VSSYLPTVPPVVLAPPKVLLIRLRGVGDLLLATPLIRAIRTRHPQAHIAVLTSARLAPLLAENQRVDEVITLSPDGSLRDLAPTFRARGYSHLLDLEDTIRTRALRALVPGDWTSVNDTGLVRWLLTQARRRPGDGDGTHIADRYFAAARALDVAPDGGPVELFVSPAARDRAARWLERAGLGRDRPVVAFAPGSPHLARRWPVEHWAELVRRLIRTGADAVMVGGTDESATASEVALRSGPRAASAAGELDLQETAALIGMAAALIVGDTGLLHVAAGVGTPAVALYGPTARNAGTYPYHAHAAVIERELPCRPCGVRGDSPCPEAHHLCLRAIRPNDVFDVLSRTLTPPAAQAGDAEPGALPPPTPDDRLGTGWTMF